MTIISNSLISIIALLHIYFLILEMFFWTKPLGLNAFNLSLERAKDSAALAANQGLYNGFLAAGLAWGLYSTNAELAIQIKIFFLVCVFIAGVYGSATVSRKIFYIQALPALIALGILILNYEFIA